MTDPFRTEYRVLSPEDKALIADVKRLAGELSCEFSRRPGREIALAKTKLEEAVMWAVEGITG